MKKLVTLILVLAGIVGTASAADYKIYIKSSNPTNSYIYVWADDISETWPGTLISELETETVLSNTYYVKTVSTTGNYNFKCSDTSKNESGNWESLSWNDFVEYNGGTTMTDITESEILTNCVALPGTHNNWKGQQSIFEQSGDNYIYVLNAPSTTFKIQAFDNWKGASDVNCSPSDWFEGADNITLKNDIGYQKFTFTAKENGSKWDLTASVSAEDAYRFTVAGNSAILNGDSNWEINAANDMSDDDLDGIFTLEVKNVNLTAGDYLYKVFRDGTMSGWQVPSSDNNTLTISESGYYTIVYTLTPRDYTLEASAIPVERISVSAEGKATFSSSKILDFTGVTEVSAWRITGAENGTLSKEQVTGLVPANTGLLITSDGAVTAYIPTGESASSIGTNMLVEGTGAPVDATSGGYTNYILTNKTVNGTAPLKFYKANGNTVPSGKAYLRIPSANAGAREYFWFEDETTGIDAVKQEVKVNGEFFNLAGQRVAQPTKGLYIVNGKKVIMK